MKKPTPSKQSAREQKIMLWVAYLALAITLVMLVGLWLDNVSSKKVMEISIIALGLLVTSACLLFIRQEHHAWRQEEQALVHELAQKLNALCLSSHHPRVIIVHIHQHLEHFSSPYQRLEALKEYHQQPDQLAKLLLRKLPHIANDQDKAPPNAEIG